MSQGNSKRIDFPIVGSFQADIVSKVNAERTINWYEVQAPDGKKSTYLCQWPGFEKIGDSESNFVDGVGRAAFVFKGETAFFVVGDLIYTMDADEVITQISSSPMT